MKISDRPPATAAPSVGSPEGSEQDLTQVNILRSNETQSQCDRDMNSPFRTAPLPHLTHGPRSSLFMRQEDPTEGHITYFRDHSRIGGDRHSHSGLGREVLYEEVHIVEVPQRGSIKHVRVCRRPIEPERYDPLVRPLNEAPVRGRDRKVPVARTLNAVGALAGHSEAHFEVRPRAVLRDPRRAQGESAD